MKYTYVANWKMNLTYNESISFCTNKQQLKQLGSNAAQVILCPSFVALAPIVEMLKNSSVFIGAQNCSEYEKGAYTGEVSAQSLSEVGITHCIVGHSERRILYSETTETLVKKIDLLHRYNITPIICVGETKDHFTNKATFTVLTEQLKPIIKNVEQQKNKVLIIAYEPIWSIGTGIVPENTYLEEVFAWITKLLHSQLPEHAIQLLYGGSITATNIKQLKSIQNINGFLIGGASTDFKEFESIIQP